MSAHRLRVGISALFDPADTPHARTFLRAVAVARNTLPALSCFDWVFLDDGADPACADVVARRFIDAGVDVVVGHFSSDAALQAIARYAEAGVPLLTPAATVDALTDGPGLVLRLCPPDRRLADSLIDFAATQGWSVLRIDADASSHGHALARAIANAARCRGMELARPGGHCDANVFAGRLAASRCRLRRHTADDLARPLLLTDDAASPHLGGIGAGTAPVYVIGFRPLSAAAPDAIRHRLQFGGPPETYFGESMAAFHLLASIVGIVDRAEISTRLSASCFDTALGPLGFEAGERVDAGHAIWRLDLDSLLPLFPCDAAA